MPCRATGTLMHEPGAWVLEKTSGNSTFIDWRRGRGISTTGSQTPACGIKICIFGRKQAVSSCNIVTADHSTKRQSATPPQDEQASFGVENFLFKRHRPNIYPIYESTWVSPTQVVPKKSGVTTVKNEKGEDVSTRLTTGWRVCIDYRRLNAVTRKDHFPLPFIDQLLERVSGHLFYCFLDGYSGYCQIEIASEDQEKTTFTCPFGTYAYRRMPFGLCNASTTF